MAQHGQPVVTQPQHQQTVIVQQPAQHVHTKPPPRDWYEGLFGCFSDLASCLCTTFFPVCYACILSTKAGENCCLPCCLPNGTWLIALRTKHRTSHNIQGSIMGDCCTVCWCGQCAMCQLAREIDNYGN